MVTYRARSRDRRDPGVAGGDGEGVLYQFIGEEGNPKEIFNQRKGVDNSQPSLGKPNTKEAVYVSPDTGEPIGADNQ